MFSYLCLQSEHTHNPSYTNTTHTTGSMFHLHNPNFKLYPLPNTGHCPMDERPVETFSILEPFLESVYQY